MDAIRSNYLYIKSQLPEGRVFYAVLKSDAYGHGIAETSEILIEAGCRHFAVSDPQEAIQIQKRGEDIEVLLLNPIPEWAAEQAVLNDLSVSVIHPSILQPLEDACIKMNKRCKIHLKVNVGLNRLGIAPSKLIKMAEDAFSKPHLDVVGLYAQARDPKSAIEGFEKIKKLHEKMKSKGVAPKLLHFANSITFLTHPSTVADGVRLGILIYGVAPPEQFSSESELKNLKPAMSLHSKIVQLRDLPKGSKIGYRAKHRTSRDSTIATIPIGYSHGLDRKLSKTGSVIIKGERVPFLGTISMNDSTIDVTGIPDVRIGDDVVIVGKSEGENIDINELAQSSGTISAEMMMRFGRGIPRQYMLKEHPSIQKPRKKIQRKQEDIQIHYIQTEKDLPDEISVFSVIEFIKDHISPQDESLDGIQHALDFALSTVPYGMGFLMLATVGSEIVGVVVSTHNETKGFIPENVFVYICVHSDYRNKGVGSRLVREAIKWADGGVKVHVPQEHSAVEFCKKLGFEDSYLEMRYNGQERGTPKEEK